MIAEIQAMACILLSGKLNVNQVVQRLGTINHDYGAGMVLKPLDTEFREIVVARQIDPVTSYPNNVPVLMVVYPVDPPPVEIFKQTFGKYTELTPKYHPRPEIVFYLERPEQPYRVIMGVQSQDNRVIMITLRRDDKF